MRKVILGISVVSVLVFGLGAPMDVSAACTCERFKQVNFTCEECGKIIKIGVCQSPFPGSCNECNTLDNWMPCCGPNDMVGSAIEGGECGGGFDMPLALSKPQTKSVRLARVHVRNCRGEYVPALVQVSSTP